MMTDHELAMLLARMKALEVALRTHMKTEDLSERDAALNALRLTVALGRSCETWIGLRALRAELTPKEMTQ